VLGRGGAEVAAYTHKLPSYLLGRENIINKAGRSCAMWHAPIFGGLLILRERYPPSIFIACRPAVPSEALPERTIPIACSF